jgi:hypothetical protein
LAGIAAPVIPQRDNAQKIAIIHLKFGLHPGNPGLQVPSGTVAPRRGEQGEARRHRRQI